MPKVDAWMAKKIAEGKNNNCTLENAAVRREWYVSTTRQRLSKALT
jgi:tyrosinase